MRKILDKIKEYDTIIIHSHIRPDGDAIGSQYGLMYLIKNSFPKKQVYVTGEVSKYVSFLGEPNMIDESLFDGALSICVDCATDERVSDKRFNLSSYTMKIDHHLKDKKFCDYEYIDDKAASCAEIIVRFYDLFKDELVMDEECAKSLYVGILTDTGHFKNDGVSSNTFKMASILMNYNIDIKRIENYLFSESLDLVRFKGYCLNNFKVSNNGFIYIVLSKDIIDSYNVSDEDAASLVSLFGNIDGYYVWAMIIENSDGIRIRLRSKSPSINELAEKYNGGGHKMASGAKLNSWDEFDKFVIDLDKLVKEYKETLH